MLEWFLPTKTTKGRQKRPANGKEELLTFIGKKAIHKHYASIFLIKYKF